MSDDAAAAATTEAQPTSPTAATAAVLPPDSPTPPPPEMDSDVESDDDADMPSAICNVCENQPVAFTCPLHDLFLCTDCAPRHHQEYPDQPEHATALQKVKPANRLERSNTLRRGKLGQMLSTLSGTASHVTTHTDAAIAAELEALPPPPKGGLGGRSAAPSDCDDDTDEEEEGTPPPPPASIADVFGPEQTTTTKATSTLTSTSTQNKGNTHKTKLYNAPPRADSCAVENCHAAPAPPDKEDGKTHTCCLRHRWRENRPKEEEDLKKSKQYKVAVEFIETEKSYSDGMGRAIRGFYKRLHTLIDLGVPILSKQEITAIFGNISAIYELSQKLNTDLQAIFRAKVVTQGISTTLLHHSSQFRSYQEYLGNFKDALNALRRLQDSNQAFAFFVKLNEKAEGFSLASLLVMPVQRLPRYRLLLEELLKATPESLDEEDTTRSDIQEALSRVERITSAINQSLHGKDGMQKLQTLMDKFVKDSRYVDLVAPNRTLLQDEPLKKRFSKKSRRLAKSKVYHFFLFNDIMVYATAVSSIKKGVQYKLKHILPIDGMSVRAEDGPNGEFDIAVDGTGKGIVLGFAKREKRQLWLNHLTSLIDRAGEGARSTAGVETFDGKERTKTSGKAAKMMGL